MKNCIALIAGVLILAGCAGNNKTPGHFCATPLPSGISIDSLADCTVAAGFNTADFDWRNGSLSMDVYAEYRYDAADVARLQAGDTIVYEGNKPLAVDSIERRDRYVIINGGIEQGGAELTPSDGGTYRATNLDDHSVYSKLGRRAVPLADDFIIIDCGENPTDPNDTIRSQQKACLDRMKDYKRNFSPLDTRVRIENGRIKEIHRHWIP